MLKVFKKIILTAIVGLGIFFSGTVVYAKSNQIFTISRVNSSYTQSITEQTYSRNEIVEAIVIVKGESILDTYNEKYYDSVSEYISSPTGQRKSTIIKNSQAQAIEAINKLAIDVDYENSYNYTIVSNAISIKTAVKNLDAIYELDIVEDVLVSNSYEISNYETMDYSDIYYSDNLMDTQEVNDLDYTGKQTAVAVIDSGMDIKHTGFTGEVNSPKYTKESLEELIQSTTLAAKGVISAEGVYYSSKIPYSFDYADNDLDVYNYDNPHGAHVAGIVGANSGRSRGVAVDTQIFAMKVFSDSGYAYDTYILAALEDCLKLDVDVANMSLGTACGSSYTTGETEKMYAQIKEKGMNLTVAAGNDNSVGDNNINMTNLPLASNPDYGLVSSPSTYLPSLSIASIDNTTYMASYIQIEDNLQIPYAEGTSDMRLYINTKLSGQTLEYVILPGVGKEIDYTNLDVDGKVVVVARGDISFTEKHDNVIKHGGVAMIVYNPVDDTYIGMQIDNQSIPAVFIANSHYHEIVNRNGTHMSFSRNNYGDLINPDAGEVSIFSSWGTTRDLEIKPEIAGPGGYIFSTLNDDEYEQMSGTSMSAPNIAGVFALLKEYVNEEFPNLSNVEKTNLINTLMMNTADPVKDKDGVYSSVRAQGAGLANALDALSTSAVVNVNGCDRPKAEVGSHTNGVYEYTLEIDNFGDMPITYQIETITMTDKSELIDGLYYSTKRERILSDEEVIVEYSTNVQNGQITVSANSKVSISIKISVTSSFKTAQDDIFINGSYVEGYTFLQTTDNEPLSVPFLGFYGDFEQLPLLEGSVYEEDAQYINMSGSQGVIIDRTDSGYELGYNYGTGEYYKDRIYFSCNNMKSNTISSYNGLLRNIDYMKHEIYDTDGNLVFELLENGFKKSFYYGNGGYVVTAYTNNGWDGTKADGTKATNGEKYTYKTFVGIYGSDHKTSIREESWTFDFKIDSTAPQLVSYQIVEENSVKYLDVKVSDNYGIATVQLYDLNINYELSELKGCVDSSGVSTIRFAIDDLLKEINDNVVNKSQVKIGIYDWAYNFTYETITIGPSSIKVNNEFAIGIGGKKDLSVTVVPSVVSINELTFTSSDDRIATVDENGVVTGVANGTAVITITGKNNVQAQTTITVSGYADQSIKIDATALTLEVTKGATLKCLFTPDNVIDKTVTWSSSDESIATVSPNGYVKGISAGTVYITAVSPAGNTDSIEVEVLPQQIENIFLYSQTNTLYVGQTTVIEMITITPVQEDYRNIEFISSDENVIKVNSNGELEAISSGRATITVRSKHGDVSSSIQYVVVEVKPLSIVLTRSVEIIMGEDYQIAAEVLPLYTTNKQLQYRSSDETIATVNQEGVITSLKVGTVKIIVSCGNVSAECYVTILPIEVVSITSDEQFVVITAGTQTILKTIVAPANATYQHFIWESSNEEIAKVNDGVVTGINKGTVIITVKTINGIEYKYYVVVNEKAAVPFVLTTEFTDISMSTNQKLTIPATDEEVSQLKFVSDNEDCVIITNQSIFALGEGTAHIHVYHDDVEVASFQVAVNGNTTKGCKSNSASLIIQLVIITSLVGVVLRKKQ